ncbi:hypothetical protein SAMN02910353_03021, partial [Ruminococcus sp. YRD2003]|uniref:hypothetical protein n=1 Tax=Ruminococcus sp. YRD2003 TaxID=1452313 RepID=UPI0008CD1E7B
PKKTEPKKKKEPEKTPNSINIINEEPKKTEPKKQEVVSDAEITKNSPFYSIQCRINNIITDKPPKTQKMFETLRDHMILNLAEIVTKTVFSAMESKELNKAEFFSQYPESDANIEETMMLKQIFNSEPMQSLEKEITSWEELVKLGKSALSENAQPFLMNYGIRNHKSFENNKNKSAENTTQKRVKTTEKETNGPTLKPTNIKK